MALRSIINYQTDDILRKRAKTVEKIDNRILTLLQDMAETMYYANGAGLAAPQVGILRRLVVIDIGTGLVKLINPVIVEAAGEQQETEGCLSIPGIYGIVKRPEKVVVKALDENGQSFDLEDTGQPVHTSASIVSSAEQTGCRQTGANFISRKIFTVKPGSR